MGDLGRMLLGFGIVLVVVGAILLMVANLSGRGAWIGRLPGDIYIQRGNWSFYFPLTTCLLLSAVLTLLFWLIGRR
jgi:hypothetical protein